MHDYIVPGINEKTHQWILKCSSGAFTIYGERSSFSFFFFLTFLCFVAYPLPSAYFSLLYPAPLLSLSLLSLPAPSTHCVLRKRATCFYGNSSWLPQVDTTATRLKQLEQKKQSERKIKRQHCKLCFVMFVHAYAMLWRNRGLLIDRMSLMPPINVCICTLWFCAQVLSLSESRKKRKKRNKTKKHQWYLRKPLLQS